MPDEERRAAADQAAENAAVHAARLADRQATEHARAADLLRRFASRAEQRLPAQRLRVRGYGGRGTAATGVTGWYLRTDLTAGLGTDGSFYVLTAPLTWWQRLRGITPEPTHPPLVLGAGGRDGQSLDLTVALDRLLPGWAQLPPSP